MASAALVQRLRGILQDRTEAPALWVRRSGTRAWVEPVALIVVCGGAYGAAMGAWRAPELALYVAVKLPLLLLATALVNALAHGMWAARLGLALTLGECLRAVLLSFALASVVLGALAPVLGYFALALQGPGEPHARQAHDALGLAHVATVALAGTLAVSRQSGWLRALDPRARTSRSVVALWLALDLVVGAQISWNLRPWFGTPELPVAFLREHPFDGTFYESVFHMLFIH